MGLRAAGGRGSAGSSARSTRGSSRDSRGGSRRRRTCRSPGTGRFRWPTRRGEDGNRPETPPGRRHMAASCARPVRSIAARLGTPREHLDSRSTGREERRRAQRSEPVTALGALPRPQGGEFVLRGHREVCRVVALRLEVHIDEPPTCIRLAGRLSGENPRRHPRGAGPTGPTIDHPVPGRSSSTAHPRH